MASISDHYSSHQKKQDNKFFSPLSFVAFLIRDPRSGIRDGQKSGSEIRDKHTGFRNAANRYPNIILYCLTLCRRYKDSAHLNVLLISIEQLLGSNHLIITILKVGIQEVPVRTVLSFDDLNQLPGNQLLLILWLAGGLRSHISPSQKIYTYYNCVKLVDIFA